MLATFSATTSEVLVRPWSSVTRAATQCCPSGTVVLFQLKRYGAAASDEVPTGVPSTMKVTRLAPVTGVVAVRLTLPLTEAPSVGAVMLIAGGVVSAWAVTSGVTCPLAMVTRTSVSLLDSFASTKSLFGSVTARNQ